ncbi:hypothetical protein RRSWK_02784 [Rhodopirellula sp. SWK7]|nr:hypothetical protein RRSWK_02784 [Rhodopirellula sp. SWK7]
MRRVIESDATKDDKGGIIANSRNGLKYRNCRGSDGHSESRKQD